MPYDAASAADRPVLSKTSDSDAIIKLPFTCLPALMDPGPPLSIGADFDIFRLGGSLKGTLSVDLC